MMEKPERTALIKSLSDVVREYAVHTKDELKKWATDEINAVVLAVTRVHKPNTKQVHYSLPALLV